MNTIDLDGREIVIGTFGGRIMAKLGIDNYEKKVQVDVTNLKKLSPELGKTITQLEKSSTTYTIKNTSERGDNKKGNAYNKKENVLYYDPYNEVVGKEKRYPIIGLAHELGHAENDDNNKSITYDKTKIEQGDVDEVKKINQNEQRPIELENIVREKLDTPLRDTEYYKR